MLILKTITSLFFDHHHQKFILSTNPTSLHQHVDHVPLCRGFSNTFLPKFKRWTRSLWAGKRITCQLRLRGRQWLAKFGLLRWDTSISEGRCATHVIVASSPTENTVLLSDDEADLSMWLRLRPVAAAKLIECLSIRISLSPASRLVRSNSFQIIVSLKTNV